MATKPSATLARLEAGEATKRNGSIVKDIQDQLDAALTTTDPDDGLLVLPGEITDTSLTLPSGLTFAQWQNVGHCLKRIHRAWRWWVGDWIAYGEHKYGEMYSQAMDETGIEYNQLAQISYVARQIPPEIRHENLSWSHHAAVAKLDHESANALLDKAEQDGWKREHLRAAAKLLGDGKIMPAETSAPAIEKCSCHCHGDYCTECMQPTGPLE